MTSWRVRSSISRMRAGLSLPAAFCAHARGGARGHRALALHRRAGRQLDLEPDVEAALVAPQRAQLFA